MQDDKSLLAAIRAHPEEDTPRLAYADWLEEYAGELPDPPMTRARAEFIRGQIGTARMSGNDRDFPELHRKVHKLEKSLPRINELDEGFWILPGRNGSLYHRGFPVGTLWMAVRSPQVNLKERIKGLAKEFSEIRRFCLKRLTASEIVDEEVFPLLERARENYTLFTGIIIRNVDDINALALCEYKDLIGGIALQLNAEKPPSSYFYERLGKLLEQVPTIQDLDISIDIGNTSPTKGNHDAAEIISQLGKIPQLSQMRHFDITYDTGFLDPEDTELTNSYRFFLDKLASLPLERLDSFGFHSGYNGTGNVGALLNIPALQRKLSQVKYLDLSANGLTASDMAALGRAPYLRNMRELNVANNFTLSGTGASWIKTPNMRRLVALNTLGCRLQKEAFFNLLIKDTKIMPHLQELVMYDIYERSDKKNASGLKKLNKALAERDSELAPVNTSCQIEL